ncbi:phage scaffolding protein [Roseburia sp. NSJ-9]|uniref:Phage scaffolding protein n=1 Tax=Roseburia lenta TaxID=2763061 RepID=A0ABR7GDR4_9FIRM|nr:phage scaffolding protein [Roseburia lenta]MBC5685562.1 phage scaffolding protein [Roseburia lenta]DAZ81177.1 MAG TPA: minor structural protein [Caudoviricetes sp.]
MKREDLEALGLSKEQIDKVLDLHHEEYDPVKKDLEQAQEDLKSEKEKTSTQSTTIKDLKKDLEEFKDADVSGMKQKIADLEQDIKEKDENHQKEIADRDFNDILREAITSANGKNAKAITALLDIDTLKASKNQKEDITAALKALTEAEDSKMLFGEPEPNVLGKGDPIGSVTKTGNQDSDAAMRAAMGLPPVTTEQK